MLDVTNANQLRLALGMGATRNQQLAEYFLRAAGVASVSIDPDGHVGVHDVARMEVEPGQIIYCCARGAHYTLGYRLWIWRQENYFVATQAAIAEQLEQLAEAGGVGITTLAVALQRANEGVATVNRVMDVMLQTGQMKEFNRTFKLARKVDPTLRYHDYLHSRKAAMLEAIAMGKELPK